MKKVLVTLIVSLLMCAGAQANLILNGGFEGGDLGNIDSVTIDNWTKWGNSGWHHDDAGYKNGDKGMKYWWDSTGMYQDFDATAGVEYTFSLAAISPSADMLKGWDLIVKAEWLDANWAVLGGEVIDRFVGAKSETNPGDGTDTWVTLSGTSTATDGAIHGRIVMYLEQAGDWGYTGGGVYFDDASVVPEPMTIALLGLGSMALIRRKR